MPSAWRRSAVAALLLLASAAREAAAQTDSIKIPVQVDQVGKSIYFVTDASSNVAAEAARFCRAHLPATELSECAEQLVAQVETVRQLRLETQQNLPGLSLSVRSPEGEELRFVHEEGANPLEEAEDFCRRHFARVSVSKCIQAMMRNAQMALEEARKKEEMSSDSSS